MLPLAVSPASRGLARYIASSPGIHAGSLVAESLRGYFQDIHCTDIANGGTSFRLQSGGELRVWPDTIILCDAEENDEFCWTEADWKDDAEEVLAGILARVEEAGVGPTKQDEFRAFLANVVDLLAASGVAASVEHPGCIKIEMPGLERALCAGTMNAEWGYDHTIDGVTKMDALDPIPEDSTAEQVADWLTRAYSHHLRT